MTTPPASITALAVAAAFSASTTVTALPPVKLSDVAGGLGGLAVRGSAPDDASGTSVSGAGDVNGDGLADVIVGAYFADVGGSVSAGRSYVVFGSGGTAAVDLADVAAGSGGFVINGIDPGDYSGRSVSGAGDVNGDGLADLIVGAPYAYPGGNAHAGEAYVVFGKADTTPVDLSAVAAGAGGFIISGIDAGDYAGVSVSGAGDVNGDGLADLVVGAWYADPGGVDGAGEAYVVFGKADGAPVNGSDIVAGTGGFVINGIDASDDAGISVAGAGDVDGDDLADVVVGARRADPDGDDQAGRSFVVFGKAGTAAVSLAEIAAGTGGFVINGIDPFDYSGTSVAGAGDVDGDGLADVIIGAHAADPNGSGEAGESYVVFGKADTTPVELAAVASGTGGFVVNGIDAGDRAGFSVSGAGDVNIDGLADVIIGAVFAESDGNGFAGESYVVFGKADTAAVDLAVVAAGSGGFVIRGRHPGDRSGGSVAGAGDVNGNGRSDLIVGAGSADPGGYTDAGESYVIYGPTCAWDCADRDDAVGIVDLLALLAAWGAEGGCDFDGRGVGRPDFLALLGAWGLCPVRK